MSTTFHDGEPLDGMTPEVLRREIAAQQRYIERLAGHIKYAYNYRAYAWTRGMIVEALAAIDRLSAELTSRGETLR